MKIKRSVNKHVEKSLKRYPSLYYGKNARIMCLDHMLFGYGTGYHFEPDGSIMDVYDKTDAKWEAEQKIRWEYDKKQWLERYEKEKKDELYINEEWFRKSTDRKFERDKWYFETFDAYADQYKCLRDGTYGIKIPEVHEIARDYNSQYSLVNNIPNNAKKEVLLAFIEILDYMLQTNQDVKWAKNKKEEIESMLESRKK